MEMLSDDSGSDNEAGTSRGVAVSQAASFNINEDFAKRFEHNKKREERSKLEEKYKANGKRPRDEDDDSSSAESEDSFAELATAELDEEISATLEAIRKKDPRIYDSNARFISEYDAEAAAAGEDKPKKEKPMYLQDYHRQNLLEGNADDESAESAPVPTYQQEQDSLRRDIVGQMHAEVADEADEEDDGFLVKKKKSRHDDLEPAKAPKRKKVEIDISTADKDPETYLSNFMAARAWLPSDAGSRFQPMDSDDSDEDARADEFEEAYNLRFEKPGAANEKLMSFGRDVGKYSVRRDELTGRKKQRELEREKKEQLKHQREDEKARLRKLKIEEVEERVQKIKEAAGLRRKDTLDLQEWSKVLDEDWDDDRWEQEMEKRFGEKYYAEEEVGNASGEEEVDSKKRKSKKPKWESDIDIKDLLPEFEDDDNAKPSFTMSSDDEADGGAPLQSEEDMSTPAEKAKSKKDRLKEKSEQKRAARKERQKIEELVDQSLPMAHPTIMSTSGSKAPVTGFRYRETSPSSFGLTPRDILFAEDSQLNQFAGLKKMAAFRDPEKKRRDKKNLSKKARLRQWRKETFGQEDGPTGDFNDLLGAGRTEQVQGQEKADESNIVTGGKKKRGKKRKVTAVDAVEV